MAHYFVATGKYLNDSDSELHACLIVHNVEPCIY